MLGEITNWPSNKYQIQFMAEVWHRHAQFIIEHATKVSHNTSHNMLLHNAMTAIQRYYFFHEGITTKFINTSKPLLTLA